MNHVHSNQAIKVKHRPGAQGSHKKQDTTKRNTGTKGELEYGEISAMRKKESTA